MNEPVKTKESRMYVLLATIEKRVVAIQQRVSGIRKRFIGDSPSAMSVAGGLNTNPPYMTRLDCIANSLAELEAEVNTMEDEI